jgi:hypothetical protein
MSSVGTTPSSDSPAGGPNGYSIVFVGLICFVDQDNSRIVLLPDGMNPPQDVQRHFPYAVVKPDDVIEKAGWDTNNAELMELGMFRLPKCSLTITGSNEGGDFGHKQHDDNVPRLKALDKTVQIDPNTANAIVRLTISSGTLEARRRPNSGAQTDVAIISRLKVPYAGEITVSVNGGERMLRLKPGTEIAVANLAVPSTPGTKSHFPIYAGLTKTGVIKGTPTANPSIPEIETTQHIFTLPFQINDGTAACGNVGCCKP